MPKNPYFKDYSGEQNVTEDITIETIQVMGRDMIYIPRTSITKDELFGEYTTTKFQNGFPLEMYIQSIDGFEGEGDILSQYGLQIKDRVELIVSRKRFEEEVKLLAGIKRPLEGDLIYFPLSKTLFEINFVEHENPFYQLGKLYTYKLTCEVFTYSIDQEIDTGIEDIDVVEDERKEFMLRLTLGDKNSTEPNYILGEEITSGSATATVNSWNLTNKTIKLTNITGTLDTNSNIVGNTSGADYAISTIVTTNIIVPQDPEDSAPAGDNENIEFIADQENIFDFTETDPFSEGNY
tara:strand:+ start:213 stop:1094 length:882 start_codon:yes stop_codon:yes gene_type:complete